jgi:hypothetical protein
MDDLWGGVAPVLSVSAAELSVLPGDFLVRPFVVVDGEDGTPNKKYCDDEPLREGGSVGGKCGTLEDAPALGMLLLLLRLMSPSTMSRNISSL